MGSVEEKMKAEVQAGGSQTSLLEGMKLLKEMQDQSGVRKPMNSELWHACAGPLVSLPLLGSLVYYFPQGHSEQVAVSTKRTATSQIPNYPGLPSQLLCQVHSVTMHADKDTDEIYAQMSLQPVNSEKDVLPIPTFGLSPSKHPTEFFCKTLTASDTSTHGGFSVPRRAAEKLFPPLDYTMQPPTQELIVRDLHDNTWTFRHIYRGQPKRHLLTTGWSVFVGSKRLRAGDSVLFIRDEKSQLLVGVRRANRQQTTLPSSVLSADSMHIGVLAAAAHAAANKSPFTIFYNPRACPSEFVIPLAKFRKAIYGTQMSVGMRFGMMFETEESGKRRYMGTIVGVSDVDPLRWPGSKWRNLQVEWDEPGCGDKPSRVSPWEIETPESLFIFPSLTSGLKRPFHSVLSGAEVEWGNLIRRPYLRPPENGNASLPFPSVPYLCSGQLVNVLSKPQFLNQSGFLPSNSLQESIVKGEPQQDIKTLEATNHKPPSIKSENQLLHNSGNVQICPVQSVTVNSTSVVSDNATSAKLNPEASVDQSAQLTSLGDNNEAKHSVSLGNPQDVVATTQQPCVNSIIIQSQFQSGFCSLQSQQTSVPQIDSTSPSGFVSVIDTNDWISYASNSQSVFGMQDQSAMLPAAIPSLGTTGQEIWDQQWNDVKGLSQLGELAHFPQLDPPPSLNCMSNSSSFRDLSVESNDQSGIYSCLNANNGGSSVLDPSVSNTILDEFCTYKDVEVPNNSDCLLGNLCSSQDVQSQITTASLMDSQAFSLQNYPDISAHTSSSNVHFDESSLLQNSSWQQVTPPIRTFTKVQKAGSVGRSIDVRSYNNYEELLSAIECMFGLEGLLNDPRGSDWKLVYVDYENDVLLVGDDPWEEFVGCVRCIRILSPSEVQQMSEEGKKLLNSTAMQSSAAPIACHTSRQA